MLLYLDSVTFDNDFFYISIPDGNTLVLNKIDESLRIEGYEDVSINNINISVMNEDGTSIICPCIIGLSNAILGITTDHKELEGKVLTSENMKYCIIDIYE